MPERSQYQRFGLVAQGQFGKVYCAFHRMTGDWVALKILDAQRSPTAGFLRELSTVLALNHPNLVKFYGIEHQPQKRCLVLDYCEGGTLRELLESPTRPTLNVLIQLLIDLLQALEHAHQQGIVHCDVKPENVLLKLTAQGWQPKLTDFGIAQNEALPASNFQGSPAYMAPEQFYGQTSPQTDVYAVGIILYECLVGRRPFSGLPQQLRNAHLNQRLHVPQTVPVELQPILHQALEKLPARRFVSATAMATALATAVPGAIRQTAPTSHAHDHRSMHGHRPIFPQSAQEPGSWNQAITLQPIQPLPLPIPTGPIPTEPIPLDTLVGVAPDQSWTAWLEPQVSSGEKPALLSRQLVCCRASQAGHSSSTYRLLLPDWIQPSAILLLSPRHGVLVGERITASVDDTSTQPDARQLETFQFDAFQPTAQSTLILFNRRGLMLSPLPLPITMGLCVRGSQPFHLWAVERERPWILLKIALRPFRLQRIPLPIKPVAIAPLSWGVALADAEGKLLLLEHSGEQLGYWQTPTPGTLVSLEAIGDQQLAIATQISNLEPTSSVPSSTPTQQTWDQDRLQTYRLNLQSLDLDLVF